MHSYMCVDICLYECYVGQRSSLNSILGHLPFVIFVVVVIVVVVVVVGDDFIWFCQVFVTWLLLAVELAALTGYLGVYFPIPNPSTTWVLESKLKSSYLADAFPRKPPSPHES